MDSPDYDGSYKLLFSHPGIVRDLLIHALGEAWLEGLDIQNIERVNASFRSELLNRREGDIIWRIPGLGSRGDVYVYLMLEFQSDDDRWMVVRIASYGSLLLQQLLREQEPGKGRPRRLPVLLPVVLYNGEEPWSAPTRMSELLEISRESPLWGLQIHARYLLIDERRYQGPEGSLLTLICELEKARTPKVLMAQIRRLQRRLRHEPELERAFAAWLQRTLLPSKGVPLHNRDVQTARRIKEVREMTLFEQWQAEWKERGLREGREEGREEGLEEGREEGLEEGKRRARLEALTVLYGQRFEPPSEALQEAFQGCLSDADFPRWLQRIAAEPREAIDAALLG